MKKVFSDGLQLDGIPLFMSKQISFGVEYAFPYPWSQASQNSRVYKEKQIKEGIFVFKERFDSQTRAIILKQRKLALQNGYKDATPPHCTRIACLIVSLNKFSSECLKEPRCF